jgi:hypothetical protein
MPPAHLVAGVGVGPTAYAIGLWGHGAAAALSRFNAAPVRLPPSRSRVTPEPHFHFTTISAAIPSDKCHVFGAECHPLPPMKSTGHVGEGLGLYPGGVSVGVLVHVAVGVAPGVTVQGVGVSTIGVQEG